MDHTLEEADASSLSPLSSLPEFDSSPLKPTTPSPRKIDSSPDRTPLPRRSQRSARRTAKKEEREMPERPKRRPLKRKWDAQRLLTDPKSPLATANLRAVLSNPMAWSALDQQDRAEILSLFPDREHILDADTPNARPDVASLLNDDSFRYDCAAYTANVAQGRHDEEWLASAWAAHERRKAGDFDGYLLDKLRDEWGVPLTSDHEATGST